MGFKENIGGALIPSYERKPDTQNKETITIIAMHNSMARDGLADGIKNNLIEVKYTLLFL